MAKMMKTTDPQKNIFLTFDNPEKFIGMIIEKTRTVSRCVGIEDYLKPDGKKTKLLIWEIVLRENGKKVIRKTSSEIFRVSDLPSTEKVFL